MRVSPEIARRGTPFSDVVPALLDQVAPKAADMDARAVAAVRLYRAVDALARVDQWAQPRIWREAMLGVAKWALRDFAKLTDAELGEILAAVDRRERADGANEVR